MELSARNQAGGTVAKRVVAARARIDIGGWAVVRSPIAEATAAIKPSGMLAAK